MGQDLNAVDYLEKDLAMKRRDLAKFREGVVADIKLGPHRNYMPPKWDPLKERQRGWPEEGGAKYRYWYKRHFDGTEHLVNGLNDAACNRETMADGRPYCHYEHKGYRELLGDEILKVVDRQQAEAFAKWERRLELAREKEAAPAVVRIESVQPKRGRKSADV